MKLARGLWTVGISVGLTAFQSSTGFDRLASGLEYRVFRMENGRYVRRPEVSAAGNPAYQSQVGKFMVLHLEYRTAKDSVLLRTRQQKQPVRLALAPLRSKGGLEEAVSLLQPGDSAVFRLNADTLFTKSFRQRVPAYVRRAGPTVTVLAKAVKLQTREQAQQEVQQQQKARQEQQRQQAAQQRVQDDKALQDYLLKNKLNAQKTPGGVYYVVTKAGTGPQPQPGQTVSVLYKGLLLNGKLIDSSEQHGNQPVSFPVGRGQVIRGWDEGVASLKQGSKAILLIPSGLAYGPRGAGPQVPPHSILRFDVELVAVK
ncbi:FKBP-type peptidyl-prolyl cis-trans isomerase [Hymenobacter weizhouensis]|uniref:FKBP-type peptidyl-prolyl cis-trans isomerase n=1 Tax=Hymenobacter sp. YIM 151500-1 TaxID=2987689 RepID=UPI002225CBD3|nr:FKBP-type peptidyl-prolyl cis-trans isomerase [Hymenobacter sp. YIM 151500-1]UYZ61688.1 FKBP-type peptidyl-prolyl cis-trans isomerase [Hymenobacter sp. YIM 151500-1]